MLDLRPHDHRGTMNQKIGVFKYQWDTPLPQFYPFLDSYQIRVKFKTERQVLSRFSQEVNRKIKYVPDSGKDTWNTPDITWLKKAGDCEDYAILKYHLLKKRYPNLYVCVCRQLNTGVNHAVLVLSVKEEWIVLDNVTPREKVYSDFLLDHHVYYFINEHGVFIPSPNKHPTVKV